MKPPPEDADSLDKNGDDTRRDRFIGDRDLTTWRSRLGRQLARVTRWLGPYATLITTLVIGMVAVVALTAIAAEVYEAVTESDGVAGLDKPLLAAAISIRTPWLDTAATALTDVAGVIGMPIIAVLAIIILTIRRHSWTPATHHSSRNRLSADDDRGKEPHRQSTPRSHRRRPALRAFPLVSQRSRSQCCGHRRHHRLPAHPSPNNA